MTTTLTPVPSQVPALGDLTDDQVNLTRFFGCGNATAERQLFGWAAPEENHNWNDGVEVGYLLKLQSLPPGSCMIRVEGAAFVREGVPCQSVTLYVNGLRLGWWSLTSSEKVVLEAEIEPEQWLVRDGMAIGKLRWHIPQSIGPCEIGIGSDQRRLGFSFMSITVASTRDA